MTPEELKKYSPEELIKLASSIREQIIDVMSLNGGHLSSNLGTVELTIALHKVFNSPRDKFIWDVSHQTYTHKILTGRGDRFHTIRQYKGLCGFSYPPESEHDHFHAGHAGTALSLALGVATARDLKGDEDYVIPIIGDATFTCGMSLEALNNLGRDRKKFIIILNDNGMSISKNVGAVTRLLSSFLSSPTSHKVHQAVDRFITKLPFGKTWAKMGQKFSETLKNLFSPIAFLEFFGLSYIGPVDGHDIDALIDTLEGVKESDNPVLIHVLTKKGQGMEEAVRSPVTHHGAKPFDKVTGKFLPTASKPSFPKVFGDHIVKMAERDPEIVAVTPAMSFGSCLDKMMDKFPERCLDVGIAESHAVTFCGGLSFKKKAKVVCSIYATFLQRAFDNLFHDVCLQEQPVVFAIDRAGISGPDGSTHHGIYDISFLNAMPGMVITQPRSGHVLKELMESAFSYGRPTAIRYPNLATHDDEDELQPRALGKAEILSEGTELLIIALGIHCDTALEVKENLKALGLNPTVVDPVFVKPLDTELFDKLILTHDKIVTIEEHSITCGLGAIFNHYLISQGYKPDVLNIGIPDTFIPHGSNKELLRSFGMGADQISTRILDHFSFENRLSPLKLN